MGNKEKILLLLTLNPQTVNTVGKIFDEVEKIHGHKKSFLCLPRKAQWHNFFAGDSQDETEERWDKAHAVIIFDVRSEEKVLSFLKNIQEGMKVYKGEIANKKIEIISDWSIPNQV